MRRNATRTVNVLAALALLAAATGAATGCGSDKGDSSSTEVNERDPSPKREARARQVAEAWGASRAAVAWSRGYYPMADAVQLPQKTFRNEADKRAYLTNNFVLRGNLPATPRKKGQVTWESGGSLTLPLIDAGAAYTALDRNSSDGPHLTVTGAQLGEMTLATSRGPATVPAWMFALEGYETPLKRVALRPSKLPKPPIQPAGAVSASELAPLGRLVKVTGEGRSVVVAANHGSCDKGQAVDVLETRSSVVLSAFIVGAKKGPCTGELRTGEVTLKLDKPVGRRVLLDGFTGRPVPYGERNGPSPSWS
ncbi:hypothetical protein [Streptomyces aureocirculatus]|uniref:hypothetical protein n=1 Tax=Streptomyces aureocirculatus TaxID=67275 RepID=UPI00099C97C0|nr:hypothetical protein [Streptomyces aureocirculatus]